jgi:O-antigen ligase
VTIIKYGAILITVAATPWFSTDALIIPKIIILVGFASYFIPEIYKNIKILTKDKALRLITILATIFLLQMVIVMVTSDAPVEQELFGRTGRGLGLLTYFSLVILMIVTALRITYSGISILLQGLLISCILTSGYSIIQFFGLDFFEWQSRTNGIIGTIGNPNFQSSFVAMALIPSIVYLWKSTYRNILLPTTLIILLVTLYITESTQGYVAVIISIALYALIWIWYRKKWLNFISVLGLVLIAGVLGLLGMLNRGPLSYYLYKLSVRSRGEMWQTATDMIKDNPLLGVGIDSLGDYSLMYRNEKTANGIAEYIDNCHNFFLQFAATGGLPLSIIYLGMVGLTLISFVKAQRRIGSFDANLAALFAAWISFQLQSIISPAAIPTLVWNFIICGAAIGLNTEFKAKIRTEVDNLAEGHKKPKSQPKISTISMVGFTLGILSLVFTYPLFKADKMARDANTQRDALLAVKAAKLYPESVVRYNLLGTDLYQSKLFDLSLEIGRSAVKFNPNSYQTWILILVNPNAPLDERIIAKNNLLRIDPFNRVIQEYPLE